MRTEIMAILSAIIASRKTRVVDNDFNGAFNIAGLCADASKEDIVEALVLLDSILWENDIEYQVVFQ